MIRKDGDLLVFEEGDQSYHVGYLVNVNGVWCSPDPNVPDVSEADAVAHNATLSRCEIEGLAECAVGEGRPTYLRGDWVVTFHGDRIAPFTRHSDHIRFMFHGRRFVGELNADDKSVHIVRVT